MSESNGDGARDIIRETLQPLVDERANFAAKRGQLRAALDECDGEIRRIDRILRAGGLLEPEKRAKKVKGGRRWGASPEMVERAEEFLPRDGEFTIRQGAEAMGVVGETAKKAIEELRAAGKVRRTGERIPAGNKSRAKAQHFAWVD